MLYVRLSPTERAILRWRKRRDHLVCKLLDENPKMLRQDALSQANRQMGAMPGKPVRYGKRSARRQR